ncbi:MAG: hypothetical protein CMF24_07550 [Ilumatobacter sp.]|nr:hypothetical protein [Ilumatobacter sp.]
MPSSLSTSASTAGSTGAVVVVGAGLVVAVTLATSACVVVDTMASLVCTVVVLAKVCVVVVGGSSVSFVVGPATDRSLPPHAARASAKMVNPVISLDLMATSCPQAHVIVVHLSQERAERIGGLTLRSRCDSVLDVAVNAGSSLSRKNVCFPFWLQRHACER